MLYLCQKACLNSSVKPSRCEHWSFCCFFHIRKSRCALLKTGANRSLYWPRPNILPNIPPSQRWMRAAPASTNCFESQKIKICLAPHTPKGDKMYKGLEKTKISCYTGTIGGFPSSKQLTMARVVHNTLYGQREPEHHRVVSYHVYTRKITRRKLVGVSAEICQCGRYVWASLDAVTTRAKVVFAIVV